MIAPKGDWFSELLHKIGIDWKSNLQWFFWRSVLHAIGGSVIGWSTIWFVPLYAVSGGILISVILWKEWKEKDTQLDYKTAFDPIVWVVFFLIPWIVGAFL